MSALPSYEIMLQAYQQSFQKELQGMLEGLPVCVGDRVLDVACGNGFYSVGLAPLVAPLGQVVGVDLLPAYLKRARLHATKSAYANVIRFTLGDVQNLPFKDQYFDLAWCAQSLFSLPDPLHAVREMARVVRPGGAVAILEDDTLHQLLLPWSFQDELLLRTAESKALQKEKGNTKDKFYIARHLRELFINAGLRPQRRRTFASHREFPIGRTERRFLDAYLTNLRQRAIPFVPKKERSRLRALLTPDSTSYLVNQPHFNFTCVDHVLWGKKP